MAKLRIIILAIFQIFPIYVASIFVACFLSGLAFGDNSILREEAVHYRNEGYKMQKIGLLEDALMSYQKAVQVDPLYVCAYNDLGIIYEMMGRADDAEVAYLKTIQLDSDYRQAYTNLAFLYERKHDYISAAKYWIRRAYFGGSNDIWIRKAQQKILEIGRIIPEVQKLYSARNIGDSSESRYDFSRLSAQDKALIKNYFNKN